MSFNGEYAQSVDQETRLRARQEMAYAMARGLHDELNHNGGFSKNFTSGAPSAGYMVSDGISEVRVKTCTVDTIAEFLLRHWNWVQSNDDLFFGGWQTEDYVYLDVSEWFGIESAAALAAADRGELAYFNLATGETIYVDGR